MKQSQNDETGGLEFLKIYGQLTFTNFKKKFCRRFYIIVIASL